MWGFATALMRPLAGESIHQFIERSGNWMPALVLVYLETSDPKSDIGFTEACISMAIVLALGTAVCMWMRKSKLFDEDCPTGNCDPVGEFLDKIEHFAHKATATSSKQARKLSRADYCPSHRK